MQTVEADKFFHTPNNISELDREIIDDAYGIFK